MTRPLKARSPQAAGFSFFAWGRSPAGAAALCVNSHNLPGRDVLSLRSSRLSRRFLPRLGPSQMAGFFTSQCFHQELSKAVIKKGDIITIKPQWQDAGDASFTWVARNDEDNGRRYFGCGAGLHARLADADRSQRYDRGHGPSP